MLLPMSPCINAQGISPLPTSQPSLEYIMHDSSRDYVMLVGVVVCYFFVYYHCLSQLVHPWNFTTMHILFPFLGVALDVAMHSVVGLVLGI